MPKTEQSYQEDGGVFLIKKFDKESSVIVDDPQR
jgi:NADH-quinone oxidoreductase subunit C